MIDWNISRPKTLTYDYIIDSGGREVNSIEARFIMVHDGYALIIQGQLIDDKIKIVLPPLSDIISMVPKNKSKLDYRLEIIINDNEIIRPDEGIILVESMPVIKTSKPKTIKENKTIKIKDEIKIKPKSKFSKSFECFVKETSKE